MKSLISICFLSLFFLGNTATAQSPDTKNDTVKIRQAILDSLFKQSVPFAYLKEKYTNARRNRIETTFPEEKMILENGLEATIQTTDNKRVKAILSKLFSMSPVDFLLSIRGIEGCISIKTSIISWVKTEDIPDLIKLATVDVLTPQIDQLHKALQRVNPQTFKLEKFKPFYFKTPMGINALCLIDDYLVSLFPSLSLPTYESVKRWYDSGEPKSEYKFEPFYPIVELKSIMQKPIKKD